MTAGVHSRNDEKGLPNSPGIFRATARVGFSHGDFSLVVQTLDNSAGKQLLSAEIVEDQFAVLAQRPGDVLHRLDARAHHLPAPNHRVTSRPMWGSCNPKVAEKLPLRR
jgi:hypothetical protein